MAFHGEDAAVTARHGARSRQKLGGVGSGSQIVYHVAGGHDAQTRIEQHGSVEDGFVIGFPVFAVALAHVDEVFAVAPCVDEVLQLPHVLLVVQEGVEFIPLVRHPPPARPSPDGEGGGEEVVGSDVRCNLLVVESGNHADACVVLILVEQFLAEAEERDGRHVVILKHDTFVRQRRMPTSVPCIPMGRSRSSSLGSCGVLRIPSRCLPLLCDKLLCPACRARRAGRPDRETVVQGVLSSLVRILAPAVWGG